MSVTTFRNRNDATSWANDAAARAIVRRADNPRKLRLFARKLREAKSLRQIELAVDNADHEQSHDWFVDEQLVYLRIVADVMSRQIDKAADRAEKRSKALAGSVR